MADKLRDEVEPLVEHYHSLNAQQPLSHDDRREFASKLESIFKTIEPPAQHINSWGYTPSITDPNENTLGNSGINPFPAGSLTAPESEEEIIAIVQNAYKAHSQVRVIGSAHSNPSNIILDAPGGVFPKNVVLITLTKYRGVHIDPENRLAVVKAGTNLGVDPQVSDSTEANGLAYQLQQAGFALPETGGILHQTIGGFLATGTYIEDVYVVLV
jgi:FAD/FMN-containing dehydrogenase